MTRGQVLSDDMWARIEPLLPAVQGRGRPFRDHPQVIEGIAWRDLPIEFGPWQTVWKRHHCFSLDGTWDDVLAVLVADADAAGELEWRLSVDSSVMRVHHHGATAKRSSAPPTSYTGGPAKTQEIGSQTAPGAVVAGRRAG